ncbi:molybdopterin-dependent oxidoreductase [Nocardia rhizosphaerihabitans]|uniref:molybdopterin-dependent oxidoreductase n=1 Tax=Nocardia rhizosphaerihabitans TaxID=1691570 RepID=UPI00366E1DEB
MPLPPGQRAVEGFPRFGTHLHHPPPPVPEHPVIEIDGAVTAPVTLSETDLAQLPRQRMETDFHCVAGWSATGLVWEGTPLNSDHGAPVRLVSPRQYGFVNTKHLCRIEFHTSPPADPEKWSPLAAHRRARVWEEERHRYLPARVVRPIYHRLIGPIRALSARGSEKRTR